MKHIEIPSPREELPEPLRSVVDDIVGAPVPEELLYSAWRLAMPKPEQPKPGRSVLVLVVTTLALGLCIAALLIRQEPSEQPDQVAEVKPPIVKPQTKTKTEQIPPPTFWAYRQAHSAEALDELLSQHASILLQTAPWEDYQPFQPFSRKEEL